MKKSTRRIATSGLAIAMAVSVAGCAFTQWTDRYYFGTAGGPPVYEGRKVTGAVILPFAIVGDVITAPIQVILLAFMGDDWLYSKRQRGTFVSANDERFRSLGDEQKDQLIAQLEEKMIA